MTIRQSSLQYTNVFNSRDQFSLQLSELFDGMNGVDIGGGIVLNDRQLVINPGLQERRERLWNVEGQRGKEGIL